MATPSLVSKQARTLPQRQVLLGWLCAAAVLAYIQRNPIAISAGVISRDLLLDKTQLAWVMACWSFGYAAMQIPSGRLADRFGAARVLSVIIIGWSLATGLAGLAVGWMSLLALWTLMGMAQAGVFPCATKIIGNAFDENGRATASGLLGSSMVIGLAIAPSVTALLLTTVSWRGVFGLYALPGLLWAAFFLWWLTSQRQATAHLATGNETTTNTAESEDAGSARPLWRRMLTSSSVWLLCTQQFLRAAAMIFFGTWFPTYLEEARGVSTLEAGFLTSFAGVGAIFGSASGGFASDRILRITGNRRLSRQGIAVVGMCCCSLLILVAYFVENTWFAVGLLSLGAFCGTFGGVSGYTVAIEYGGKNVATVFSTMNMCGNIGAGLFPLAAGWLVHAFGMWDPVLFLFAGIFAVDAVCWALLNPRGTLDEEDALQATTEPRHA